jgi:hypothetical protein
MAKRTSLTARQRNLGSLSLPKTDSNVELARGVYRALADRAPTDELIHPDAE